MNYQNESEDTALSVTLVEKEGTKLLAPRNDSTNSFWKTANSSPQAGDCIEPNNYLPLNETNSFFCPISIVLGSTLQQNSSVLPDKVTLTVTAGRERCVYDLQVTFTNPKPHGQENDSNDALPPAVALLTVPRLPDVLLLEEAHTCGDVSYQTRVEESTIAEAQYNAAAASNTQTATLSETAERVHHVQMDKVPAGEQATFRLRFLQVGGLKRRQAVLDASRHNQSAEMQRFIADLAIVPGYVGFDAPRAVPFELKVRLESGLKVEVPEKEVMYHDMSEIAKLDPGTAGGLFGGPPATTKSHILSIVQLGPSLVKKATSDSNDTSKLSWFSWKSPTGLARGTLLKIRLVDESPEAIAETASTSSNSGSAQGIIQSVDTIEGICHDPATGSLRDSTLVDITVPLRFPPKQETFGVGTKKHQVYIIVDTSGSTAMRKNSNKTFLDTCKVIMDRIFQALPAQIKALHENGALSGGPIIFHLWSFDSDARAEIQNYQFGAGGDATLQPLQFKIQGLKSGGYTNYDAWSKQLQADVSRSPADLHSVLLVTDGGATHRFNFLRSIGESLSTTAASSGFFQVDCLGYGPWLDPTCVTQLANKTGGEALMVDTLEEAADSTGKWVTGILARSLLRASSRLALKISGGDLLAVANIESNKQQQPPSSKYSCAPFSSPHTTVDISAGQQIRMILLHDSGIKPVMSLEREGAAPMGIAWTNSSSPQEEAQDASVSTASADNESWPNKKLSDPMTKQTLRHLALLEPAFGSGVGYPAFSAESRKMVTLATSKRGQVVAPSVTKGVAVASLSFSQDPVPENCRPKPTQSLWSVDETTQNAAAPSVKFQDDPVASPTGFASFGAPAPGDFLFGAPRGAGGFESTASAGIASFGNLPSTPSPFGTAPTPSAFSFCSTPSTPFGSHAPASGIFQSQASPNQQAKDAGPPSIAVWVRETRGGLFPDEQKRMHLQAVSTRLTASSLNSGLRGIVKEDNPLVGVVPGAVTSPSTVKPTNLNLKQALHLIECAVRLYPGSSAGPAGSFEKWIESNRFETDNSSDLRLVLSSLRFAARLCGIQELKPGDTDTWPWAGGIQGYSTASVTPEEIEMRKREHDLFTPSVRREIYRILRNPQSPQKGATVPNRIVSPIFPGAALLAKASVQEDAKGWDTFVFSLRADIVGVESNGYSTLDDAIMLDAVANIGNSENPMAVAVTLAFEAFLEKLVEKHWGDEEASCLSIDFLLAFGREMTSRLDVTHRIRSTMLSAEELTLLRSPRLSGYIDEHTLNLYQGKP